MTKSASLALALEWAARGFPVFPLGICWDDDKRKTNKVPKVPRGHLAASTDPAEVRRLWAEAWPCRNGEEWGVGMRPGPAGYVVLDPDVPDGPAAADAAGANHTQTADTPSGGEHRYFRKVDPSRSYSNQTLPGWKGKVDVRADNGYVVAPGTETSWGSWTLREHWDDAAVRTLPESLELPWTDPEGGSSGASPVKALVGDPRATAGSAAGPSWRSYDSDEHDATLHPLTVETHRLVVEEYGVDPDLTTFHRKGEQAWLQVTRPGKGAGVSGTVGFVRPDVLWVFSSAWDGLDPDRSYSLAKLRQMRSGNNGGGGDGPSLFLRPASSVVTEKPCWAWQGLLPTKGITLLAGREGVGKTTLAMWIVAGLTRGTLPGEYHGKPQDVALVALEDSQESTLVPRLIAARADLDRVKFLSVALEGDEAPLVLPGNVSLLHGLDVALLVLDPLISRVHASLDTHKDQDVRQALEPLTRWSTETGTPVLGLIHVNKSGTKVDLDSLMGSKAFPAVARSVLFVARDPEDDSHSRLLLLHPKCNVGPMMSSRLWWLEPVGVTLNDGAEETFTTVRWGDEDSRTVADILHAEQQGPEHTTQIGSAIEWLRDFLHGPDDDFTHEPVESSAVKEAGKKEGYSADVIKRAAKRLNVDITNTSTVPRRTLWALPGQSE